VIANALYSAYNDRAAELDPGPDPGRTAQRDPVRDPDPAVVHALIPPSLVEAARVDGAGLFRAFVSIVLPISRNSLITAGCSRFLFSWSDFLFALTLTTKGDVRPVTLGIYQYLGTHVTTGTR
jgi:multiple sugar transport system permease protein